MTLSPWELLTSDIMRYPLIIALLMGLSNLGGMFGVETAGGWLYTTFAAVPGQVGRDGDRGLVAVLAASAVHLGVLAGLVRWLAGRGDLGPPAGAGRE